MRTVKSLLLLGGIVAASLIARWLLETAYFFSQLALKISPAASDAVFWIFIAGYIVAILGFALSWFTLPVRLALPQDADAASAARYYSRIWRRLKKNRHLQREGKTPAGASIEELRAAQNILDEEARRLIQDCAKRVFVATAVSPAGRIDSLIVLAEEARLVWRLGLLYRQRISPNEFAIYLMNVAADSFAAMRLSDVNIAPTIHRLLARIYLPHAAHLSHAFPLVGPAFGKMIDPIINNVTGASLNALFILKTGLIAQRYCQFEPIRDRVALQRDSYQTAINLLPKTIGAQISEIAAAVAKSPWDFVTSRLGKKKIEAGTGP